MKTSFVLIALLIAFDGSGQCPGGAVLKLRGSDCQGKDTLFVSSTANIRQIVRYNGSTADTTVTWVHYLKPEAITVAGGNGSGGGSTQFFGVMSVFVDTLTGEIYVPDFNNARVQKFPKGSTSATGGVTVAGGNGQGNAANQLDHPYGVSVDKSGSLFVGDDNNERVQKFPPGSTSASNGVTVAGGNFQGGGANQLYDATFVFTDASGYLYVTDFLNSRIQRFPPGSVSSTNGFTAAGISVQGKAANELADPGPLFVDRSGNIFVADFGNDCVKEFPPNAPFGTDGKIVAGASGLGNGTSDLTGPTGVWVDSSGNLYVTDAGNARILKYPPGSGAGSPGVTVAGGNGNGSAANQLNDPGGIFFDGSGNLFVADDKNERIQEFINTDSIDRIFIPATPGTYTAVVTDSAGCTMTTNAIVIRPLVASGLTIAAAVQTICAGDTALFTSNAVNGGSSPVYQWQVNGSDVGTGSDTLQISSLVNGDLVSCILTSSVDCTLPVPASDPVRMTVTAGPSIVFNPDTVIIAPGGRTVLDPVISGTITQLGWTPETGLDNPSGTDPSASPVVTTTYTLSVTADNGCRASGKGTVIVYYPLRMPSAFTPNGDGKNDLFRIPPAIFLELDDLSVFSRWGGRVFSTRNSGEGWDGTFSGSPQPAGTYVWVVRYRDLLTGKREMRTGTVLLIR